MGGDDWVKAGKPPPLCGVISLGLLAVVGVLIWMVVALA